MSTTVFHNIFTKGKERETIEKQGNTTKELPKVIIDYREKNSLVASELVHLDLEIEFQELKIGDYLVNGITIERKTVSDFISSMINKHLLQQLQDLQQIENKLLIIEGIEEQELYNDKEFNKLGEGIHPNSIRGFLLSILLKHKIPIIFTKTYEDTAKYILLIAKKKEIEMSLHFSRKAKSKKEQIQFILEGFPGIGPKTAKKLIKEFKTIKNIINASEEDLKKVLGKKAESLFSLISES